MILSGFKRDGQIVRQFVSSEGGSNSADIVALFSRLPAKMDLATTEVNYKGTGKAQADEFVEILNRGTEPADISGWTLGADDSGQGCSGSRATSGDGPHLDRQATTCL
ncbi:lamin tail-like protein [Saccharopolyspora erythraea NRRL 2338]|uniref:Uncharacterized protein n=2 Tax=Saccharopolyspora erythraea TaxID=1836 RepID=A4FI74_SACEN|nr:lamin tail domain-containing protein [Saccharopolyspora erythraea]EQD83222.1 hypothetical protein N599_26440 [Saccharopolyspora erythraea D]PFG97429.1 lamin tail-like protein [Saccharopolyspora erythraea NRRL 2338]QRK87609.1 lamin tail domain-containing protein [Saccharopolyspora erythraea]CAM03749.1 hypothetical protein SACE_4480 [Saccharopolyspora erythraea NRRL 2338]